MLLAIDPSISSLGWAILTSGTKVEEDKFRINQELYHCKRHGQLETYDELDAECTPEAEVYLKAGTTMTAIGGGEFEGGGHCTSLDPSWYTAVTVAHPRLVTFGTVKRETGSLPLEQRMKIIIEGLVEAVIASSHILSLDTIVIERPQLWGAYKSTASMHQGALIDLLILTGALCWWASTICTRVYLIPVTEWKGQLPKKITQKRMEAKYGVKFTTNDESDACGLGDYWLTERTGQ